MRHVTPEEETRVEEALHDVGVAFKTLREERDELGRRRELAVSMIDGMPPPVRAQPYIEPFLETLRSVLAEGARPDLERRTVNGVCLACNAGGKP